MPPSKRQAAAQELARSVDAVVVVGGRNSANTTRLASLCRVIQPRTFHIETASELEAESVAGARRVGITAGASTPEDEIAATRRASASLWGDRITAAPGGLRVDQATGAAARAGVQAGDRIVAIDGVPPEDVLDLELAAADGDFALTIVRRGSGSSSAIEVAITPGRGEDHGIGLDNGLGVPVRQCANDCTFCFIAQVPPGLRPSLSLRDDDYRLSFLHGTFVTLTNFDGHDLERIVALRLSPLFVSLHAWDDEARAALMGPCAGPARERLAWLSEQGIETHLQVVLCPGVNDGAILDETVRGLLGIAAGRATAGGVLDVGVVPVSLAKEERGLRRVTAADAAAAVARVEELQRAAAATVGRRFVHAADELYLLLDRLPPPGDAPEQYENGVGICAATLAEADALRLAADVPVALLGGRAAAPVLDEACRRIMAGTGATARVLAVDNELFGPHVTVTGLLGGREVVAALRERPLAAGEWLLAPRTFLPEALGRTLDDFAEAELSAACGGRLGLGHDLAEAAAAIRGA